MASEKVHTFPVMEIFGPTLQGEGILLGVSSHFVRFGGCSFNCSWCDSNHAVDPVKVKTNATRMNAEDIMLALSRLNPASVITLTGGDPCIHEHLGEVINELHNHMDTSIAVETQGHIFRKWLKDVDIVTISPKPPSSLYKQEPDDIKDFLIKLHDSGLHTVIKPVIFDEIDLEWAIDLFYAVHSQATPLFDSFIFQSGTVPSIYDMNEANARHTILRNYRTLCDTMLERYPDVLVGDVRILPQQHALIWPAFKTGK